MGKKSQPSSNKAKGKRLERKAEQRRLADCASIVLAANKTENITALCGSDLLTYSNDEMEVELSCAKVTELPKDVLDWAIDLTERNMKHLYETCAWGWNKNKKSEEMSEDAAWYLIAREKKGTLLAFSHFRFDMDYGTPVVYCYELQVEEAGRRRGLGARLMAVLERLGHQTKMSCVRLTALRHNPAATQFFKACGYTLDETSPELEEAAHYEILSKATTDTTQLCQQMSQVEVNA